ncbi:MAG: hypothetical protein QF921_07270 [Pseudomonadales bacterium]|jgi:hypothetical protein|nr:hypothetical protein [Pseudomonadales bacterium]MDP6469831.1 hypothetical protein [Pseudomonadales bacterium]MDP6827567.1 hypothetical protein [Pseudomonadales bacterium]MDP6971301.1 hypothetical protein [Pseudomonadales bacterium]|tara:strand:+ start:1210 stop:2457 length:1248 start_codon:yes stop_codon:yes gene_type:complete
MWHASKTLIFVWLLSAQPALAASLLSGSLGLWLDRDAAPELTDVLGNHPRFKGEALHFARSGDALTQAVEQRLSEHLLSNPHIRLVWRPTQACKRKPSVYRLQIDIHPEGTSHGVSIRVVDVEESQWIGGVSLTWRGRLNREQRTAFALPSPATGHLTRLSLARPDELAQALAQDMACRYVLPPAQSAFLEQSDTRLAPVANALRRRLSNRAWTFTDVKDQAESFLRLSVHESPPAARVEVHLFEPDRHRAQLLASAPIPVTALRDTKQLLSPLVAAPAQRKGICRHSDECAEVSFRLEHEAYLVVFSTANGRVRSLACDTPELRDAGERRFRLKVASGPQPGRPGAGFYVLATHDAAIARRLAAVLNQAPGTCRNNVTHGGWLTDLRDQLTQAGTAVSWRAMHLRSDDGQLSTL